MRIGRIIGQYIYLVLPLFFVLAGCGDRSRKASSRHERIEAGSELFSRYGCAACHSMEGEVLHGPALNEIWQKPVKVIREGVVIELKVDRSYLKRSIMDPNYEKLVGFESRAMPKTFLTEEDTESIIDYIVSVNKTDPDH